MWRALVSAIGFLTRLPVPNVALAEADVARGAGFFSWVGVLIAAILWLAHAALHQLGPSVSAMCVVALWAWLTGALHLDGLADTVDGLSGGRGDRARTLSIMRDSRIGAHGAVALCLGIGLKWVALDHLFAAGNGLWIIAPIVARFACTTLLASFRYAREQGLGTAFADRVGPSEVLLSALVFVPMYTTLGKSIVLSSGVGLICAWGIALRARAVLEGLTGDVHGAAIEISEIGTLLALGAPVVWA